MKRLQSFVYVSTYATQANNDRISESVDSMVPGLESEIIRRNITGNDLNWMIDLCRPHATNAPNSYSFTKNIAEVMVKVVTGQNSIPCIIIRPPVVCAPFKEPEPGFIDDARQAIVSFTLSIYLGLLCILEYDGDKRFIYNTVDVIVNTILVAAHDITKTKNKFRVVNACKIGPSTDELLSMIVESGNKYPSMKTLRPLHRFKSSKQGHCLTKVNKLIQHYMFAFILDTISNLMGKKTM